MITKKTILLVRFGGQRIQLVENSDTTHYSRAFVTYDILQDRKIVRSHIGGKASAAWGIIEMIRKEFCGV